MKLNCAFFYVAVLVGVSLGLGLPASAQEDPRVATMQQVHELLHKAWAGDDTQVLPSVADRMALVQQAQEILKKTPNAHFHGHRVKALEFLSLALTELKNGDTDGKAKELIRSADDEARDVQ